MIGIRSRTMILKVAFCLLIISMLKEGVNGSCKAPPENIAVYEGTENTLIYFQADPNDVGLDYLATTDEETIQFTNILNNDDTVSSECAADFTYDYSSGLTIKSATATVKPGHQRSTAGFYLGQCNGIDFSFQFLVVRQGPTCSCTRVNSESVQLTCSSIYAFIGACTIDALFTLYVDDEISATEKVNDTTRDDSNTLYISTSTFTSAYSDTSNYQCEQTFSPPLDCSVDYLAKNAPNFNQRCSFACPLATTDGTTTTTQPPTTTTPEPLTTTQPPTSTTQSLSQTQSSTTTSRGPPPGEDCSKTRQCQPEYGTDNTGIYMKSVVRAQLYTRSDKCCSNNQTCGVVVTLQYGNRYLIHDAVCNDNSLKMAVVAASCMSSDWKLERERSFVLSNVGAIVLAGNIAQIGSIIIPCIQSCNAMMSVL